MESMKHIGLNFFLLVIAILFFGSCNERESTIMVGEDWINTSTKVLFLDTITARSSTFKFDSLAVTNPERLLIGAYTDPILGLVRSKAYVQFSNSDEEFEEYDTEQYNLLDNAVYDSINLILKYDNYVYNDTIPSQRINVHEVLEDIEPKEDSDFYNTTSFETDLTPLGSLTFNPKPIKTDSISIRIDDDFGKKIFNKILNNEINNQEELLEIFKGVLISPEDSNTVILGFSTDSSLRIYYTLNSEFDEEEENFLNFTINTANSFNAISNSFNNELLESLNESENSIESKFLNNTSIIQAGTGISTKIDIPYLENIYDINGDNGILINANLKISIQKNSSTNLLKTRDSLSAYIIDNKFNILGSLVAYEDDTNVAYAELSSGDSEYNIKTYSLPIKLFLESKLTEYEGEKFSLALYSQEFNQSVDRYILAGENSTNNIKLKIELFYAIYDE